MQEKPRKAVDSYLRYSGLGFQMVGVFVLAIWLGSYADKQLQTSKPVITLVLLLLAVVMSVYLVIKELKPKP